MNIRICAIATATVMAGLLVGSDAQAQSAGGETSRTVEFSDNASAQPAFPTPGFGRHAAYGSQLAALPSFPTSDGAAHTTFGASVDVEIAQQKPALLEHLFLSGIADLVRGDPAEATDVFAATESAVDEIPQADYLLALSYVLSDFTHRDRAIPLIKRALAKDPDHALYGILDVVADRDLSVLEPDGALSFTPAGAKLIHVAATRLPAQADAYNGNFLIILLAGIEKTTNPSRPERLAGFSAMLGQGRSLALPKINAPQALGRLFVLTIPQDQLARSEGRFLANAVKKSQPAMTPRPQLADQRSVLLP